MPRGLDLHVAEVSKDHETELFTKDVSVKITMLSWDCTAAVAPHT